MTVKQSSNSDIEDRLVNRAIKELTSSEQDKEALVLIYFPQYDLGTIREIPHGDFNMLFEAARRHQVSSYRMHLIVSAAAGHKDMYKSLLSKFDKILKS